MAQQGKTGPTKLQWALIITAVLAMIVSGATSFFPNLFPVSGEDLANVGLIAAIISTLLAFTLMFTVATKKFQS